MGSSKSFVLRPAGPTVRRRSDRWVTPETSVRAQVDVRPARLALESREIPFHLSWNDLGSEEPGDEAMASKPGQHVVPNGGKWSVRKAGSTKASGTFNTQQEAIQHARGLAQHQQTELYIHGQDGRIRERDSFGRDRHPPRG